MPIPIYLLLFVSQIIKSQIQGKVECKAVFITQDRRKLFPLFWRRHMQLDYS